MFPLPLWFTPALFATLSILFAVLTVRDRIRNGEGPSPARRTWTLIAVIFAAVSAYLFATLP